MNSNNENCILIVDDEQANILLLSKILNFHGYHNIIDTTEPEKVIDILMNNSIHLILMDINMPSMTGYEVLEKIKGNHDFDNIPVIAISGDISQQDVDAALEAGFVSYVTKPMDIAKLIEIVSDVI